MEKTWKGDHMINAIGEASVQQVVRANHNSPYNNQLIQEEKSEQIRQERPIEASDNAPKSDLNAAQDQNTTTKHRIEEGQVVVEKYDEHGKLLKKTPPGYVPFGEIA